MSNTYTYAHTAAASWLTIAGCELTTDNAPKAAPYYDTYGRMQIERMHCKLQLSDSDRSLLIIRDENHHPTVSTL